MQSATAGSRSEGHGGDQDDGTTPRSTGLLGEILVIIVVILLANLWAYFSGG